MFDLTKIKKFKLDVLHTSSRFPTKSKNETIRSLKNKCKKFGLYPAEKSKQLSF